MKPHIDMPKCRSLITGVIITLLLAGCSLPKIIILHDPLSTDEHVQLGMSYESQGKWDLAAAQYREAVAMDKRNARAWNLLGDLSYQQKNYDAAESAYRKVLDLQPGNGDTRNNLAWIFIQRGTDLSQANELVAEAIRLLPDHKPYYLDTRGMILLREGNLQAAIAVLKEAVETIPREQKALLAEAYGHLAEALKAAGEEQNAADMLRKQHDLTAP